MKNELWAAYKAAEPSAQLDALALHMGGVIDMGESFKARALSDRGRALAQAKRQGLALREGQVIPAAVAKGFPSLLAWHRVETAFKALLDTGLFPKP